MQEKFSKFNYDNDENIAGSKKSKEQRNRLAYLALYYAIQGDKERSEEIRNVILKQDKEKTKQKTIIS